MVISNPVINPENRVTTQTLVYPLTPDVATILTENTVTTATDSVWAQLKRKTGDFGGTDKRPKAGKPISCFGATSQVLASLSPSSWHKLGLWWYPNVWNVLNRLSANVSLKEEGAGGCFHRWFIHKPDPEGARCLEIELQDGLLGAQVTIVKQPYACLNQELVQQGDASDVGVSTVVSPKMQSRRLEAPVSLGPPPCSHSSLRLHPGKAEAAHSQTVNWCTQGPVCLSASFPGLKRRTS